VRGITWSELERKLKKAGWKKSDDGGKRAYMFHPSNPKDKIPFGRHPAQEVKTGTADKILKDAGLK